MGTNCPQSVSKPIPCPRQYPLRPCLRKGCLQCFHPARYNQRYCGLPACRREVRRWQAAKRQHNARAKPAGRLKHAQAERDRRQKEKTKPQPSNTPHPPAPDDPAWSRGCTKTEKSSGPICDRPGCYQPPRYSLRNPANYCSHTCRHAMRSVLDRERKFRQRNSFNSGRGLLHRDRQPPPSSMQTPPLPNHKPCRLLQ